MRSRAAAASNPRDGAPHPVRDSSAAAEESSPLLDQIRRAATTNEPQLGLVRPAAARSGRPRDRGTVLMPIPRVPAGGRACDHVNSRDVCNRSASAVRIRNSVVENSSARGVAVALVRVPDDCRVLESSFNRTSDNALDRRRGAPKQRERPLRLWFDDEPYPARASGHWRRGAGERGNRMVRSGLDAVQFMSPTPTCTLKPNAPSLQLQIGSKLTKGSADADRRGRSAALENTDPILRRSTAPTYFASRPGLRGRYWAAPSRQPCKRSRLVDGCGRTKPFTSKQERQLRPSAIEALRDCLAYHHPERRLLAIIARSTSLTIFSTADDLLRQAIHCISF